MAYIKQVLPPDSPKYESSKSSFLSEIKKNGSNFIDNTGINGEAGVHRIQPNFLSRQDRKIITGTDNSAAIIVDNDPIYAKDGGDFSSRILLVAGVHGHELNENEVIEQIDLLKNASGVYISQKTNPQEIFLNSKMTEKERKFSKLVTPVLSNPDKASKGYNTHSAVTTFADTVQIVATNGGVNIYAGGIKDKLASGVDNNTSAGVSLIYGNRIDDYYKEPDSPYTLEPMVKGDKLRFLLEDLIKNISDMNTVIFNLQKDVQILKASLSLHTHAVVSAVPGLAVPSIELIAQNTISIPNGLFEMYKTVANRVNSAFSKINQSDASRASIVSRFHRLN